MIPVIASGGRSFQGAFAYYMHDKNAQTTTRIAWTHTMNMMTSCVEKAHKVMAFTAKAQQRLKEVTGQNMSGRKLEKPVFAYSLAWHPEEEPDKQAMLEAAKQSLERLGFTEYEVAIVAHSDEPHRHIHIIVNRTHPITGMAAKLDHTKRKLSAWAHEYELKQGKVYCKMREENQRKHEQGQHTHYNDPVIAQAWQKSHNVFGFDRLLANKGYQLARGRKRLVVVDPHDKAHNPVRHLKGLAKAAEFHERMDGLDHEKFPAVEAVIARRNIERKIHSERLRAHEDKVADTLSKAFSRHCVEREKLTARHLGIISRKADKLAEYYKLDEQQVTIDQLTQQLEHPNMMMKLSFKFFKTDRKISDRIGILKKNKENAEQRIEEAMQPLLKERDCELQSMEKRHKREIEQLADHLAGWEPKKRNLSREWSQAAGARDLSHDHDHRGPNLNL